MTETIMKRKVYDHVKYITLRSKSMFSIMKNRLYDHEKYTILLNYMVLTESIRSLAESIRSFEKIIRSFPDDLLAYDLFIESRCIRRFWFLNSAFDRLLWLIVYFMFVYSMIVYFQRHDGIISKSKDRFC